MTRRTLFAGLLSPVMLVAACASANDSQAISIVAKSIDSSNTLTISRADLATKANPMGKGTIVYAKQGRPAVWVVLDSDAYAMNSPAKQVTPSAPWGREAPEVRWATTNLDRYSAVELLKIVGRSEQ